MRKLNGTVIALMFFNCYVEAEAYIEAKQQFRIIKTPYQ